MFSTGNETAGERLPVTVLSLRDGIAPSRMSFQSHSKSSTYGTRFPAFASAFSVRPVFTKGRAISI
ncbi:MAG: hypothetical protein AAGD00_03790, partial [Planctomycetota bacterium]